MNYKVKIIVGFRRDQEYSIDANEAHKAYYLFNHPDKRGTFNNGLAISNVQDVVPDYQGTMGWNPTHILDNNDWNEIRKKKVHTKLRNILASAKEIAKLADSEEIKQPLSLLLKGKYKAIKKPNIEVKQLSDKLKVK